MTKPRGRSTLRKGQLLTDPGVMHVGLWELPEGKPGSSLYKLERSYLTALDAVDQVEAHQRRASGSGKYTEDGVKADVLEFATKQLSPKLKAGRRAVEDAKRELTELRSKLTLKRIDKTDFVGAFLRSEMRAWFWNKKPDERLRYLDANIDRLDPELALALIELPQEIVGIAGSHRTLLMDGALRAQHGDALDDAVNLETGIKLAERALDLCTGAIAQDCGTTVTAFAEKAAPFENAAPPPWLQKITENGQEVVRVLDLEARTWRKPTEQELASGRFYANWDDFNKDRSAA